MCELFSLYFKPFFEQTSAVCYLLLPLLLPQRNPAVVHHDHQHLSLALASFAGPLPWYLPTSPPFRPTHQLSRGKAEAEAFLDATKAELSKVRGEGLVSAKGWEDERIRASKG